MNGVITSEVTITKCIAIYLLTTKYGYTGVEIAEFIGITPQSVSSRKSQGRRFHDNYPKKALDIRKRLREQGIFPIKRVDQIEGIPL